MRMVWRCGALLLGAALVGCNEGAFPAASGPPAAAGKSAAPAITGPNQVLLEVPSMT